MPADEFYLGLLDDLHDLHVVKSSGYGTESDALANFTSVAAVSGDPPWRYPRLRALEKIARLESLERQGRLDELEEEHLDAASLLLCAEALRRRAQTGTDSAGEPSDTPSSRAPHPEGHVPSPPAVPSPAEAVVSAEPRLHSSSEDGRMAGLRADDATTLFAERLCELAGLVDLVGLKALSKNFPEWPDGEIAAALRAAADLIGLTALAVSPYVAPCAHASEASEVGEVMHAAHTSCKSAVFCSDQTVAEILSRRFEAAGREDYERRRTAPAVAGHEPARLRDAQQGDDGRVRA